VRPGWISEGLKEARTLAAVQPRGDRSTQLGYQEPLRSLAALAPVYTTSDYMDPRLYASATAAALAADGYLQTRTSSASSLSTAATPTSSSNSSSFGSRQHHQHQQNNIHGNQNHQQQHQTSDNNGSSSSPSHQIIHSGRQRQSTSIGEDRPLCSTTGFDLQSAAVAASTFYADPASSSSGCGSDGTVRRSGAASNSTSGRALQEVTSNGRQSVATAIAGTGCSGLGFDEFQSSLTSVGPFFSYDDHLTLRSGGQSTASRYSQSTGGRLPATSLFNSHHPQYYLDDIADRKDYNYIDDDPLSYAVRRSSPSSAAVVAASLWDRCYYGYGYGSGTGGSANSYSSSTAAAAAGWATPTSTLRPLRESIVAPNGSSGVQINGYSMPCAAAAAAAAIFNGTSSTTSLSTSSPPGLTTSALIETAVNNRGSSATSKKTTMMTYRNGEVTSDVKHEVISMTANGSVQTPSSAESSTKRKKSTTIGTIKRIIETVSGLTSRV